MGCFLDSQVIELALNINTNLVVDRPSNKFFVQFLSTYPESLIVEFIE